MPISNRYADFGCSPLTEIEEDSEALENVKLESFESGYQAGWEDAVKAHSDGTQKAISELGQRLEDMSFTYHEVYAKLTLALKPLMVNIILKLLPTIAEQSLHVHILQEVKRVSDLLCMSNMAHASLTKEHDNDDDFQGRFRRAAERR
jgi:flagellar biosynthesis/type III secretory pathway protein FliH